MDAIDRGGPHGGPEMLGEILSGCLAEMGLLRPARLKQLAAAWREAAGDEAWTHTRIVGLRQNVLEVEVDSAGRLYELANFQKRAILARLSAAFRVAHIRDIRFRQGALTDSV